jgi:hypothetical protein
MTRPLKFRDQFGIRLSRLPVMRVSRALPFLKVPIDSFPVSEVERKYAVYVFEGQGRVAFNHALY